MCISLHRAHVHIRLTHTVWFAQVCMFPHILLIIISLVCLRQYKTLCTYLQENLLYFSKGDNLAVPTLTNKKCISLYFYHVRSSNIIESLLYSNILISHKHSFTYSQNMYIYFTTALHFSLASIHILG